MSDSPWGNAPASSVPSSADQRVSSEPASAATGWDNDRTRPPSGRSKRPSSPFNVGAGLWLVASALFLLASGWSWSRSTLDDNLMGYLCAGLGATTCTALYRLKDVEARASKNYEYRPALTALAALLVVAALGLAALHVWPLAGEWSK